MFKFRQKFFVLVLVLFSACADEVSSDAEARQAYTALDPVITQALDLGFAGFATAKSANIDPQTAAGAKSGTVTVAGKVDQGSSDNKNMDLTLALVAWSADGAITFGTSTDAIAQPKLSLSLKKLPDADLTGTLIGTFSMTGEMDNQVTLNLALTGKTMADGTGKVVRKPASMRVTGTATAGDSTFVVDLTR